MNKEQKKETKSTRNKKETEKKKGFTKEGFEVHEGSLKMMSMTSIRDHGWLLIVRQTEPEISRYEPNVMDSDGIRSEQGNRREGG